MVKMGQKQKNGKGIKAYGGKFGSIRDNIASISERRSY